MWTLPHQSLLRCGGFEHVSEVVSSASIEIKDSGDIRRNGAPLCIWTAFRVGPRHFLHCTIFCANRY